MNPPRLGVVADDITGAGSIGSLLAARGWAVRVFTAAAFDDPWRVAGRLAQSRTDCAIIDSDSRFDHPELAREKVRRATEILLGWGPERLYKTTCSPSHSNPGPDAMLEVVGEPGAMLAASALAGELARVWPAPAPFDPLAGAPEPSGGALVVAGSTTPQTRSQIAALESAGAEVAVLETAGILDDPGGAIARAAVRVATALAARRVAVLRCESSPEAVAAGRALGAARGLDPVALGRAVSLALAETTARALAASATSSIVALGSNTAAAICDRLRLDEMLVLDQIVPGLPVSLAVGPPARLVVLKSGSFGEPDVVLKALARLG